MNMIPYGKLRGRIIETFGRYNEFARAMGMSCASLTMRLHGKTQWKQADILKACDLLGILKSEVCDYFFTA